MDETALYVSKKSRVTRALVRTGNLSVSLDEALGVEIRPPEQNQVASAISASLCLVGFSLFLHWLDPESGWWVATLAFAAIVFAAAAMARPTLVVHTKGGGEVATAVGLLSRKEIVAVKGAIELALQMNARG